MSLLDPRAKEREEWYRWRGKADADGAVLAEQVRALADVVRDSREESRQQNVAVHQDLTRRFDKVEEQIGAVYSEARQTNGRVTKLEQKVEVFQARHEADEAAEQKVEVRVHRENEEHRFSRSQMVGWVSVVAVAAGALSPLVVHWIGG